MYVGNYDLEERTLEFSKRILRMIRALPKGDSNRILNNQCLRSATSVGANYREANDALGNKDFLMRLKIVRKEAKETKYWLDLIVENNLTFKARLVGLLDEITELIKIFSKMISNFKSSKIE
jgi:four helix bundle protein